MIEKKTELDILKEALTHFRHINLWVIKMEDEKGVLKVHWTKDPYLNMEMKMAIENVWHNLMQQKVGHYLDGKEVLIKKGIEIPDYKRINNHGYGRVIIKKYD